MSTTTPTSSNTNVSSNAGTSFISGLASGIDWSTIVDELIAVDEQSVTNVQNLQSADQSKFQAWQSLNTQLLSLKTAADAMEDPSDWSAFTSNMSTMSGTSNASDLLSVSTGNTASPGNYTIQVDNLAQAEQLTSNPFTSASTALGSSYAGNIVINGSVITVNATDTLADVAASIKQADTGASPSGVTADALNFGTNDSRLILTSDKTGAEGINLTGTSANLMQLFGWASGSSTGQVSNSMTSNGSAITASTLLTDIDGYNTFTPGDSITLSGSDTAGSPVTATLDITSSTTVQDLLNQINSSYGNVLAYVTSDGKIEVDDLSGNQPSKMNVELTSNIQASGSSLAFSDASNGAFGAASAVLVAGQNATVQIDGVPVTSSSNTIDGVIPGVTLNLLKADNSTTINLNVTQDTNAIETLINNFVTAYNAVASTISTQDSYNTTTDTPGGVLFGDNTLLNVNSDLTSAVTQSISGVNSQFSSLAEVGISVDQTGQMSVDNSTLTGYLQTNFNDVMSLFVAQGTTSSNSLTYVGDTQSTQPGSYTVDITQAATQSAATSDNAVSGTLGSNDNLTIKQGSNTATIDLTEGMSLNDIINAIKTELATDSSGQPGGHYAMDITASANGNQLVLTSTDYGSASSFTITDSDGVLWNSTLPQTFTGQDVAGTIGGEAATGSGQVLTGNTGNTNTAGLSVQYTGSSSTYPVDAGTINVTNGVAELFDRALTNITDPYSGYVTFKETSLQNSINNYTTQITQMNDQIAQKKQQMLNEFVNMETAISTIQSESSWLSSQLTAATNGWQLTAATSSTSL